MPSTPASERMQRIAVVFGLLSLGLALCLLLRWIVPDESFFGIFDGRPRTKPNSAVGFVLSATGLLLGLSVTCQLWRRIVVGTLGSIVALGAGLTLVEYLFNTSFGIDSIVPVTASAGAIPGRPSAHTAAAMLPTGLWVLGLVSERMGARILRNTAAIFVAIVIAETAIGYIYGVSNVPALDRQSGMPVTSLTIFAMLFIGLSAARPGSGIVAILLDDGTGGYMLRRVGLGVLLVPFLIGLVLALAGRSGALEGVDNVAISTATTMVVGLLMIAAMAARLTEYDRTRQELTNRLRDLSERDSMTGVFNRRRFDSALEDAIRRARGREERLALAMIDVDKLKQVNDNGGHVAGDRLITGVADAIVSCVRADDVVARIGGDEFAVVLPGVGDEAAKRLGRSIVDALIDEVWTAGDFEIRPSVSIGIVITDLPPDDPDDLTKAADEALYVAKGNGGGGFKLAHHTQTGAHA